MLNEKIGEQFDQHITLEDMKNKAMQTDLKIREIQNKIVSQREDTGFIPAGKIQKYDYEYSFTNNLK